MKLKPSRDTITPGNAGECGETGVILTVILSPFRNISEKIQTQRGHENEALEPDVVKRTPLREEAISMYSAWAIEARRCQAVKVDGTPCCAWSVWGDTHCVRHGGHSAIPPRRTAYGGYRSRVPPCDCPAYNWPHRPGSGLCQWPHSPQYKRTTPAGTHTWPRARTKLLRYMVRYWRAAERRSRPPA